MQSKVKANSIVTHALDNAGNPVFTVIGHGEYTLHLSAINQVLRGYAEVYGWIQRVTDMAAVPVADGNGEIIPKAERTKRKAERIAAVIAHLETGTDAWNMRSAAPKAMDGTLIVEAVAKARGVAFGAIQEYVTNTAKAMNVSRQVVLDTLSEEFAEEISALRQERTKDVDKGALLAGLPIKE